MGLAAMITGGCNSERDADDGERVNSIVLPTDTVLNLYCENVGIADETCVLDDPENPYATTTIIEPSATDSGNKFDLYNAIPRGPTGAKARFYLFATALAYRQSGENQYYTALALHELFDANSTAIGDEGSEDELIREQALKAYRSVLDNFFGSVTVFECVVCGPIADGDFPQFAVPLNERVADHLFRTESTDFVTPIAPNGLRRLVPGSPILVLDLFVQWGYTYQPCTDLPACTNGVVGVGEF
jgi:hypothetical protein